jgi:hypothetical protein
LREAIDFIASGALGGGEVELFRPLVENLLDHDPFLLLADYQNYIDAQERVSALWSNPQAWDAPIDPQHRAHGKILLGSLDPRLLRTRVENPAVQRSVT